MEDKDLPLEFQTQFKKEMFDKHANKLIYVDPTHGMKAYDFQIVTANVTDDYNKGIFVVWLLSNKEMMVVFKTSYSSLRECCGNIHTQNLKSDDAEAYYNNWVSTFSRPHWKLLHTWHIDCS